MRRNLTVKLIPLRDQAAQQKALSRVVEIVRESFAASMAPSDTPGQENSGMAAKQSADSTTRKV